MSDIVSKSYGHLALLFLALFLIVVFYHTCESYIKDEELKKDYLFKIANSKCKAWLNVSTMWSMFKVLVIIVPFMSSALLLYLSLDSLASKVDVIFISTLSMVFSIFGSSFDLSFHAQQYRKGFDIVKPAINKYIVHRNKDDLLKALNEAEKAAKECFK